MRSCAAFLLLVAGCSPFAAAGDEPPKDAGPAGEGGPTPPSPNLRQGLVAHWKFDDADGSDVARDSSGSGLDLAVSAPHGEIVAIDSRRVLQLAGTGVPATVPFTPAQNLISSFTIAAQLRFSSAGGNPRIFLRGFSIDFKLNGRRPQLSIYGVTPAVVATANYSVPSDEWHHITVTFSSGAVAFYSDGRRLELEGSTFGPGSAFPNNQASSVVGAEHDGANAAMGYIDELVVWNRALSDMDVAAAATGPL